MIQDFPKISGVPNGFEAWALHRELQKHPKLIFVLPNESKMILVQEALRLVMPDVNVLVFPAWDTVPYDRTAPAPEIVGQRIATLVELMHLKSDSVIVLTTASAFLQRVPPRSFFRDSVLFLRVGNNITFDSFKSFLLKNGYRSTDTVMEVGEFAVRGGLTDVFPAGARQPIRIDFFGDEIDSIKFFDPLTQRTTGVCSDITLKPMTEFVLTSETISLFRSHHRDLFERQSGDGFYEAVSEGRYIQGLEHFLPLFHKELVPLWSYLPDAKTILDFQTPDAFRARSEQITSYYDARTQALKDNQSTSLYQPIPPDLLFLTDSELEADLTLNKAVQFSPFIIPDTPDAGGRSGHDFVDVRVQNHLDIFDVLADYIRAESRTVILSVSTDGAGQRISGLLRERGVSLTEIKSFPKIFRHKAMIITAPFEKGFSTEKFIVITETDLLGDRIIRPVKRIKNKDFISDLTTLNVGDLVVHQKHGIGRFIGLTALQLDGAPHDCLSLEYEGGDKLFVPVENMDVLSRYGHSEHVGLDRLGSASFAGRKERVKKDLFQMASRLMTIASTRALNHTERILPPHGFYQEFCAHFPYAETEDQTRTIQEIENDLASGHPMDRLICGDVGFGKTEVAMRAAFLAAMNGYQVAVVVPTTLLARQHTQNFKERFSGFPIKVAGLSRLTTPKSAEKIKRELEQGTIDIIVGTHTLLSPNIHFRHLGLVIVDEEQHFGVTHKERLKELEQGVHVLTLTATPIPRTLQLSLSGVKELSVIATPPVDRLVVKTFVTPFDPVIIKEALLREHFRGGQSFFVCPRISDMPDVADLLKKLVPDIRVVQAHGQMSASKLESIMTDFADHKYDVLLATSIIESGLDMPSVNTIVVYRADMFGLAALYQLRGRVGRGKLKAYAYLTTPVGEKISDTATKRLTVMQNLDSLGAGFALASHDLDIRGAGNLLGQEQSGHIREVGVALYQKMLAEAIQSLRRRDSNSSAQTVDDYSPQITVGLPVLIPESYIADLDVRMGLYHRMGDMTDTAMVESLRAELTDRFGPYPIEVENLLQTIELKIMAKTVNIERLEAGPRGASISFRNNTFPNPAGLIAYIESQLGTIRIRPDQKLVVMRPWTKPTDRLTGVRNIIHRLSEIVLQKKMKNG